MMLVLGMGAVILAAETGRAAPARLAVVQARFDPPGPWPVAAPVTLTVQFDRDVLLASWQWLGADGRPATWAGAALAAQELRPVRGQWIGRAAAPPLPGAYGVQFRARAAGASALETITLDLRGATVAEARPLARGLAFVRDGNLWLRALDGRRERALTFYGQPAQAAMPAWAPDGRRIAFIYDAGTVGERPALWLMLPDGSGARRVVRGRVAPAALPGG
jgi:hypothetical protein